MNSCLVRPGGLPAHKGSRRLCCCGVGQLKNSRRAPAARITRQASSRRPKASQQPEQESAEQQGRVKEGLGGQHPGSSDAGGNHQLAGLACAAAATVALPLLLPAAASASSVLATLVPYSLQQQQQPWQTVCWGCTAVGAASLLVTLVCTSRFLVSYYPSLERQAEQQRYRLPWMAVTLFDPLLQPLRRRFFGQTEEGDLDYAAVALLALVCSLLECLVGKDGIMLPFIPDFALRDALQYLVVFQHGFLLPLWVIVVLRWGRIL